MLGWVSMTDAAMNRTTRWAWAEVDLGAYAHNIGVMQRVADKSDVWAVVKANAYGHGAVPVARAAVAAGASGLCVAVTSEGVELRDAGIECTILVFSEQPISELEQLVASRLVPTVYNESYVEALASVVRQSNVGRFDVHMKVDTGMHRVGVEPKRANAIVECIDKNSDALRLAGVYTHFAAADAPEHVANEQQSAAFLSVLNELGDSIAGVTIHAVNSAGAMSLPMHRHDFIRVGIAGYGIVPGDGVAHLCSELRPVMSLHARVSHVQHLAAGEGVSYGHRGVTSRPTVVATLPIGYADGVPRRLWSQGGAVLLRGKRCPIIGVVTMDQLMVDCGDLNVEIGDEAVLIGRQGSEEIRAEHWASALDTIGYEITCGIGSRVPRVYTRSV